MIKIPELLLIPGLLIASTLACNLSSAMDSGGEIPDGRTENHQPQAAIMKGHLSAHTNQVMMEPVTFAFLRTLCSRGCKG